MISNAKSRGVVPRLFAVLLDEEMRCGLRSENKYCISAPITSLYSPHQSRKFASCRFLSKRIENSTTRAEAHLCGCRNRKCTPNSIPPTEIDFEALQPNKSPAISTPKDDPRDNTTPIPTPSQNTASITATEPKMGDTRTVDGQQQVYFLGFGWIEDIDTPNVGIYAEDMYENGNKVGNMGGGEFVDGEGDINKMVGTM